MEEGKIAVARYVATSAFALCVMVELGPENEWIGLPFRSQDKQAIRSCGFLRFIGPLASVLLVAFLSAATNP